MPNRVDIAAFQKVMIVYNRNSGKQLFASMLARVSVKPALVAGFLFKIVI